MKQFEIHQITHLPPKILALEKEAVEEGFRFITRLMTSGTRGRTVSMHAASVLWWRA